MERALVLQLLDTAWKDHLLAMDHLRSSVGLRGYAQIDPKVEYKREGMRIFEQMWTSVGERTTDLIFRMEQLDEGFVGSTWKESEAIHQDAQSAGEIAAAAAGGHRRHRSGPQAAADPQPPAARGPQRSLPLRQREEVQELLHEEGVKRMSSDPVIDEIRAVRHRISEQFGHDPKKLVEYYIKLQERHRDRLVRSTERPPDKGS